MSFTRDEKLERMRDLLNTLMKLVKDLHLEESPYFMRFLDRMKNNIETCICVAKMQRMEQEDWGYLKEILRRDWDEANREDMGIPAYDRAFSEKIHAGKMSGLSYITLLLEIDEYLYEEDSKEQEEKYEDISGWIGV